MSETFTILLPQVVLALAGALFILAGTFAIPRRWFGPAALAVLGITALCLRSSVASTPVVGLDSGLSVRTSALAAGFQYCCLAVGALFVLQSVSNQASEEGPTGEFYGMLLLMLDGLLLVGVANDLITLFLSLELISIPTYVLLYLGRRDPRSQEASVKYFLLSIFSAAMLLYGMAFIYGLTGSTQFDSIRRVLIETYAPINPEAIVPAPSALGLVAIVFLLAGLSFKMAAVPFHFYAPDVYEGTSPGNAALLSTLPKVAGIVVLARLLSLGFVPAGAVGPMDAVGGGGIAHLTLFWQLATVLAAVTMTVGNVMALLQKNLRRLLACSSIAHAGYLLVGIAAAAASATAQADRSPAAAAAGDASWTAGLGGLSATLFYLATYVLATVGIFAAVTYLGHRWPEWKGDSGQRPPREEITTVDDLDGLSGTNPVAAFALAVFLLSLAGIPPLPGFWGKLGLATSALEVDWNAAIASGSRRAAFVGLSVVLVLNAAIAAAYYLRIIAAMYFRTTKRGVQADGGLSAGVAMLICLALVVGATLQPRGLFVSASRAGSGVTTAAPAVRVADLHERLGRGTTAP